MSRKWLLDWIGPFLRLIWRIASGGAALAIAVVIEQNLMDLAKRGADGTKRDILEMVDIILTAGIGILFLIHTGAVIWHYARFEFSEEENTRGTGK
jgi:multisubunit Na+/H+ antiporter MnhB subunit